MNKDLKTLAQKSKRAIQNIHIAMLHVFTRGYYKPMSNSGITIRKALLELQPEIYGSMSDDKKFELDGLIYVLERLPKGIENCRYINLIGDEGLQEADFQKIVPQKRRRNCYRISKDQMYVEITRGKSDIYDILTHLTFMYLESHKLLNSIFVDGKKEFSHEWLRLEETILSEKEISSARREILFVHMAHFLGTAYEEIKEYHQKFAAKDNTDNFFSIIYWLGKLAVDEHLHSKYRLIHFSDTLIQEVGHHIYGNKWAKQVKSVLENSGLIDKNIHIISANMHSVLNVIYARTALEDKNKKDEFSIYEALSDNAQQKKRSKVFNFAIKHGTTFIKDVSGANIDVQIINTEELPIEVIKDMGFTNHKYRPVIVIMDYAFGEQAYETMDELLKPHKLKSQDRVKLNVQSISIMGKAGILCGKKGDIMIPNTHIVEGTTDNYTFKNELDVSSFKNLPLEVFSGNMITVLGTSLQNKFILQYFKDSSWNAIGLEMEGAHYQKAIQVASKIRKHISDNVKVRYAYYASDNPLESGSTLASGGLGMKGVIPTYAITKKIIEQIFNS